MIIKELDKKTYKDYPVPIEYDTDSYYDLIFDGPSIEIRLKSLDHIYHHHKDDLSERLYQEWLDNAVAYGAFEEERLIGVIELGMEYSKRLVVNLLYVDREFRRKGVAEALMNKAKAIMYENNIRSIILETQSCNVKAIAFYLKQGFRLIGFDTICYSNHDIENKEVRLDFGFINDRYAG